MVKNILVDVAVVMNAHISMCWVAVASPSNYTLLCGEKNWKYFCYQHWVFCGCRCSASLFSLGYSWARDTDRAAWEAAVVIPQNRLWK